MLPESIHSRSRLCKEIILLFSAFFLPGILLQSQGFNRELFGTLTFNVQILVQAVPQILLLLYILEISGEHVTQHLGLSLSFRKVAPVVLLGSVGLFTLSSLMGYAAEVVGKGSNSSVVGGASWNLSNPAIIPLILLSSLAIGYREELFFRAYLITRLDQMRIAPAVAVGVSALLFAVGHLYEGIAGALTALVSGLFLALIYLRGRNLHQVALSHALYNFVALILSGTAAGGS
ncbi:CPBP family intramembrane glutamic endopeptidase [Salinispira pacifica]